MSVRSRGTAGRPGPPSLAGRLARWASAKPLLALGLLALVGVAAAAITLSYSSSSTLTTSVVQAPVQFEPGADAGPSALSTFVTAYSISTNKTYVAATVKGVPEASMVIDSFVKLHNVDAATRTVTLSTAQVSNDYLGAYTLRFYDGASTLQGTLTLTAASPSVTLVIPAGETWTGRLTLDLLTGAGADNVALSPAIAMTVT